jgi:transposase-like protein
MSASPCTAATTGRRFNERTGTALKRIQVPTDIVFPAVFWRLRYKLSLRDLAGVLANAGGSRWS